MMKMREVKMREVKMREDDEHSNSEGVRRG